MLAVGNGVGDVYQGDEVDPQVQPVQDLAVRAGTEPGPRQREVVKALPVPQVIDEPLGIGEKAGGRGGAIRCPGIDPLDDAVALADHIARLQKPPADSFAWPPAGGVVLRVAAAGRRRDRTQLVRDPADAGLRTTLGVLRDLPRQMDPLRVITRVRILIQDGEVEARIERTEPDPALRRVPRPGTRHRRAEQPSARLPASAGETAQLPPRSAAVPGHRRQPAPPGSRRLPRRARRRRRRFTVPCRADAREWCPRTRPRPRTRAVRRRRRCP